MTSLKLCQIELMNLDTVFAMMDRYKSYNQLVDLFSKYTLLEYKMKIKLGVTNSTVNDYIDATKNAIMNMIETK